VNSAWKTKMPASAPSVVETIDCQILFNHVIVGEMTVPYDCPSDDLRGLVSDRLIALGVLDSALGADIAAKRAFTFIVVNDPAHSSESVVVTFDVPDTILTNYTADGIRSMTSGEVIELLKSGVLGDISKITLDYYNGGIELVLPDGVMIYETIYGLAERDEDDLTSGTMIGRVNDYSIEVLKGLGTKIGSKLEVMWNDKFN
jgi:hypothetical protein